MKNSKTLLLVLPTLLLLLGCCTSHEKQVTAGSTPQETQTKKLIYATAQKYLDATGRYDVADASRFCTPETAKGLRYIETALLTQVDSADIAKNMPARIRIDTIRLTSDTTAIVSFHKRTPLQALDGTVGMVFRDGHWMAHMNISVPENIKQAASGDTVHFNYDDFQPGDLKPLNADTLTPTR